MDKSSRAVLLACCLLSLSPVSLAMAQSGRPGGQLTPGRDETPDLHATEPTGPAEPAPRLPNGRPDLSGYWKGVVVPGRPIGNIGRDLPGFKLPFTPLGQAALTHNLTQTVDPEARCILGGIPRHNTSNLPFEIFATPTRVAFLYGYTTFRIIPIDGRKLEPDPDPTFFGNASAHWEGDALVIESNGFKDSKDGNLWIDENANPESDATTVVERWTRPDRAHIHLEMTVTDPKYYARPIPLSRTWVIGPPGAGMHEYACNENNLDFGNIGPGPGTIRPDGTRGYDDSAKLPAVPPGPDAYN